MGSYSVTNAACSNAKVHAKVLFNNGTVDLINIRNNQANAPIYVRAVCVGVLD